MNILVLGATGRTGKRFTQMATFKGHEVTAIIRDKDKGTHPGVKKVCQGKYDPLFVKNYQRTKSKSS